MSKALVIAGNARFWRPMLLLLLMLVSAAALAYVYLTTKLALRDCALERWNAQIRYGNQRGLPLSRLLVRLEELPPEWSHHAGEPVQQPIMRSTLYALDAMEFLVSNNSGQQALLQEVFWFGTESYAKCRFNQMTAWDVKYVPEELALSTNRRDVQSGAVVASEANCSGKSSSHDANACTWVGIYGPYVTRITAAIGNQGISLQEFGTIISHVDKKIGGVLNIR